MSGRKMDRHRAMAVLNFNYPPLTIQQDPEWAEEMVDMLTEDAGANKRDVCAAHGLMYPPREFMEWYFADDGRELTYGDVLRMHRECAAEAGSWLA